MTKTISLCDQKTFCFLLKSSSKLGNPAHGPQSSNPIRPVKHIWLAGWPAQIPLIKLRFTITITVTVAVTGFTSYKHHGFEHGMLLLKKTYGFEHHKEFIMYYDN